MLLNNMLFLDCSFENNWIDKMQTAFDKIYTEKVTTVCRLIRLGVYLQHV